MYLYTTDTWVKILHFNAFSSQEMGKFLLMQKSGSMHFNFLLKYMVHFECY